MRPERAENPPALPRAFLERAAGQLGEEFPAFRAAMDAPPVRGIRMNPTTAGGAEPFRDAVDRVPWCPEGRVLRGDSPAGQTIAHEAGAFYLQEPGAMIPAAVMNARPGERILDLCAAPGGKSTQMGAGMRGEGLLICNEPVPKRAAVLSRNIERMGIGNAIVTCAWPEQLAARWPGGFDGVLADVPCSGEGMFRREPESRLEWSPEKAAGCAERQRKILEAAAALVRPGGRLVYATCTFHPEENEGQVARFLEENPDFYPEAFSLPGAEGPAGMFTCWPHRSPGEGQFAALLRRKGSGEAALPPGDRDFRIGREAEGDIRKTRREAPWLPEPNACLGTVLTRAPEIPDLKGIRVLRLGLHTAEIRGRNLIPDHAAARAAAERGAPRTALTEEEALRYLAGEAIPGDAEGWTVMTWQGLVLGWGKGSGGLIRNHYPKGLRNGRLIG